MKYILAIGLLSLSSFMIEASDWYSPQSAQFTHITQSQDQPNHFLGIYRTANGLSRIAFIQTDYPECLQFEYIFKPAEPLVIDNLYVPVNMQCIARNRAQWAPNTLEGFEYLYRQLKHGRQIQTSLGTYSAMGFTAAWEASHEQTDTH